MTSHSKAWLQGFIGILIFSATLPCTRIALQSLDPWFITWARACIAGVLAIAALIAFKAKRPEKRDILPLTTVVAGTVIGFPLFTSLALQYISSARALVFIGMLPMMTALFGMMRGGERPGRGFWFFSATGCALVVGYALSQQQTGSVIGELLMLCAIVVCGLGYAEGARLTRRLGGWQTTSWALAVCWPLSAPLTWLHSPDSWTDVTVSAWMGLAYVSVFSMLVGFVFWYRGLAQGGIALIGQLQLLQPFMGMALASWLLGEVVTGSMVLTALAVVICVAGAKWTARPPQALAAAE